jgi:hypothetical protein
MTPTHFRLRPALWVPLLLGLLVLARLVLAFLPPADPERLAAVALERELVPGLAARLAPHGGAGGRELVLDLSGPGRDAFRPRLQAGLDALAAAAPPGEQMPLHLSLAWSIEGRELHLRGSIRSLRLETFVEERYRLRSPWGWR